MSPTRAELTQILTAPGAMFEIEERDIRGIRTRTWKNAPPSLRSVLEQSRIHASKDFLVYEDERLTFDQHYRATARIARVLHDDWGVRKGDRVAIAMRNFPEWSIVFWGAAAIGAVLVPLNAWWTAEELEYGLEDSGTKVVFCDGERAARIAGRLGRTPHVERLVVARAEARLPAEAIDLHEVLRGASEASDEIPEVAIDPEDDATIFYTSGTTGKPKGALGTHRNICGNLLSIAFVQVRNALGRGESLEQVSSPNRPQFAQLLSVPLFHATGCHSILVANTAFGGRLVMMYKWDPARALELIEREKINSFGGVPAMVMQVLEDPSFSARDLSSVNNIGYGGAPAPPDLVRRIKEHFPDVTPGNGYGLTETSSVTTFNMGKDYQDRPDSVGQPVPICEIKIVDEKGHTLPVGSIGEIWIKGPNVVKGYWRKPEATAETFTDGWLHSGDVGHLDAEGFLYISDRAKDMLIRGGENVYCVEVESALYEHPAVMDAAVIGVPHRVLGEEVGAIVTLAPGKNATVDELRAHVAKRLAAFKVPAYILLRGEPLPRNPNGKILKRQLRDEIAQALERRA
jgi:long-chain acyl-CoA synthetase